MCYIFILFFLSWDKIYYIVKGEGDDFNNYFNSTKYEMCPIHNTAMCGCAKKNGASDVIEKYISFYKRCSTIIEISDGKIRYVGKSSKDSLNFNF